MPKRKDKLKEAGLKEIRLEVKPEHEQLVRLFADKLKTGILVPGDVVKIE
jgi:hypothetical protein